MVKWLAFYKNDHYGSPAIVDDLALLAGDPIIQIQKIEIVEENVPLSAIDQAVEAKRRRELREERARIFARLQEIEKELPQEAVNSEKQLFTHCFEQLIKLARRQDVYPSAHPEMIIFERDGSVGIGSGRSRLHASDAADLARILVDELHSDAGGDQR